ncbi:MAG: dCMP deaminase family protein [Oscillospiraceae bacterium]|nr:dCMP deaminase family protein [Oscillospiraceae bacterium]MBR4691413.1 dCMP deaminase family protein [Oscillospiraceae bacterium]
MRKDKANYYLDIADAVRSRSTCLRRQYGAIIVASDEIIATGYNGAPRGRKNCDELGRCTRQELQIPSGERYELCRAVHAEENAIISAARKEMLGSTLYLVGRDAQTGGLLDSATPCTLCRRSIINAGIRNVVCRVSETEYTDTPVTDWIEGDDTL